jgi:hypothetical protein
MTRPTDVTDSVTLRKQDVTDALRARRYRHKKNGKEFKAAVTVRRDSGAVISTPEMCALAARLGDGRATPGDLAMAERLIVALVNMLPPDSMLDLESRPLSAAERGYERE